MPVWRETINFNYLLAPLRALDYSGPMKTKYTNWTLIDWDGNASLNLKCWRKSFNKGHVSIGVGDFRSIVYSHGPNSEESMSGYRTHSCEESMKIVDRNRGFYNSEDN